MIDFPHDSRGFGQGDDDFLVVDDVVVVQHTALAVFEPFLCRLVAADVKVLGGFGDGGEVLGFVDVYFAEAFLGVGDFVVYVVDEVVAGFQEFLVTLPISRCGQDGVEIARQVDEAKVLLRLVFPG